MKIAFNAIRVSKKAGSGFDTFIINFLNEFAKYVYEHKELNIDFDIFTLYPQHFPQVKKENIKQIKFPFVKPKKNISSTLQQVSYEKTTKKNVSRSYAFAADYFRLLWNQFVFPFMARKYDLVVALTEYDGIVFGKNQVVVIHSAVPFLFPHFPTKYRFYTYKLLPKIIKKCQKIITVSNILKKEISKIFEVELQKIAVIYEGIDQEIFYPADNQKIEMFKKQYQINGDYILTVGHSHPIKNFSGVVTSFVIVQKNYKINLVVAGYIDKKIEIPDGVKYIGHVSNEQLYLLYSGAKCFVFPTLHEGFGLPPLEAMSCGCPVVVSNKGSLPEVCGDAAVYVDPYDPQSIAEGVLKVLTDKNLRDHLIKKGFEQVKKFSWENSVYKFIEMLKNL
ncbi:MAG: glycosyltransferase family 4 protein [Endomicrobiia bacterium]